MSPRKEGDQVILEKHVTGQMKHIWRTVIIKWFFPSGSDGKESAYSTGDPGSTPESGTSPGMFLEKEIATHTSIPWTEEPCRL